MWWVKDAIKVHVKLPKEIVERERERERERKRKKKRAVHKIISVDKWKNQPNYIVRDGDTIRVLHCYTTADDEWGNKLTH